MEWVNVKDRLPEDYDYVLVWHGDDGGYWTEAWFLLRAIGRNGDIVQNVFCHETDGFDCPVKVPILHQPTHWMIPESPKEDE